MCSFPPESEMPQMRTHDGTQSTHRIMLKSFPNRRLHAAALSPTRRFTPKARSEKKPFLTQKKPFTISEKAPSTRLDRSRTPLRPFTRDVLTSGHDTTPACGVLHSTFDAEGPGAPGFFIRHSAFDAEGPGAPGFDILQRSFGKPFSHAFLRESPPDPARRQSDRQFLHGPANSDGSAVRACPLSQQTAKPVEQGTNDQIILWGPLYFPHLRGETSKGPLDSQETTACGHLQGSARAGVSPSSP
jgi:hypothetical protein